MKPKNEPHTTSNTNRDKLNYVILLRIATMHFVLLASGVIKKLR